jgi:hypothetical protein
MGYDALKNISRRKLLEATVITAAATGFGALAGNAAESPAIRNKAATTAKISGFAP